MQGEQDNRKQSWRNPEGTRTVVAAFGLLCGLTGIIAGLFEMLQGNATTGGFVISTIGPGHAMADDFTYFAVTIIPNFLVTGMLAVLTSSMVMVWSVRYIRRPRGVVELLLLCTAQTLVGGGWVVDVAAITCILATRIGSPLTWWQSHLPNGLRSLLARVFPLSLTAYALIAAGLLGLTIMGTDSAMLIESITLLAGFMFIPMLLMIFGGLATDLQRNLTHVTAAGVL
jgi:hypothetical protein